MKPTKAQIKVLKFYAKYHNEPMTPVALVRAHWLAWLVLVLVVVVGASFIFLGLPAIGWVYIGISLGAFLRDVSRIIATIRVWPMLHEVTNWERLFEIIKTSEEEVY